MADPGFIIRADPALSFARICSARGVGDRKEPSVVTVAGPLGRLATRSARQRHGRPVGGGRFLWKGRLGRGPLFGKPMPIPAYGLIIP